MKVTEEQYINLNADLKAAKVADPKFSGMKHFLENVMPDGPLKEARVIDVPDAPHLPVDWNWETYIINHKDLRDAKIFTQELAEDHYLANGYNEHRWPCPPPPDGWSDAVYLELNPDVAGIPIYLKYPLAHYLDFGKAEGRKYKKGWIPTTPGLHLILDIPGSGRPLFTGMRFDKGLLLGDYGGHLDGAQIQYWDGVNLVTEKKFSDPKGESVFHLIAADDGVPICSLERYGMMARRNADGSWTTTRTSPDPSDLSFGIFRLGIQSLQCLVCTSSRPTSSVIESGDQGRTWHGRYNFPEGQNTQGCANSDGQRILLSDKENGRPVIRDLCSNIVARRDDLNGRGYTQLCGKDGRWNFAGNNIDVGHGCFIDYWENGVPRTVFNSDRRYAMWTEADPNSEIRVSLFAAWKEPDGHSQAAYSRDGGKTWDQFTVPCPCLFGSHFADGGVYLFGGDWGSGRVYFYKF